jgi:transglutaminase-like putative cysteine protease
MDLSPYIAKGFPGEVDRFIAEVGVRGVDREQAQSMVRVCPETEEYLYGGAFSSTAIRYQPGTRPKLESIARQFSGTATERALAAMAWVSNHVQHPHIADPVASDRALSEEQLIESGLGWCNEQVRVFIALCETMETPARLVFLFHGNGICSHTAAEVFLDGRWRFFDVTFGVVVRLPDEHLADARELSGERRDLAHEAYAPALNDWYARLHPTMRDAPGWSERHRPDPARGGDLLESLGICNYIIASVETK